MFTLPESAFSKVQYYSNSRGLTRTVGSEVTKDIARFDGKAH